MRQSVKEIFKYGIVGVVGLVIEWVVFLLLRDFFNINYVIAHGISCVCAIINNFILNSYFTFKTVDRMWKRAVSFFSIAGIGLMVSVFMLPLLVRVFNILFVDTDILDVSQKNVQDVSKLMTTVIIAGMQFFLNKYFTFKKREK